MMPTVEEPATTSSVTSRRQRFVRLGAVSAVAVVCIVGAVNALIDPFGMNRMWLRAGVNLHKPAIYHRVRLFKAYEVLRARPRALVLGSSRSHLGFRCSHAAWTTVAAPCYNLAFDGATAKEMFAYLQHADAGHDIRTVVLGLDSYHLLDGPASTRPDFDPLVLRAPSRPRAVTWITGDARLMATLDALRSSIETVRGQHDAPPEWFAPDGQRVGEVFFRSVEPDFVDRGPRYYFDAVDHMEVGFQTPGPAAGDAGRAVRPPVETSFTDIERIVRYCAGHDIDLRIALTPAHVHQYEISRAVGAWAGVEAGKRRLVTLLATVAAEQGRTPFPVWDFATYSSVTTEPLPPANSRIEFQYYWDSSHFKAQVGDFVLDRLFDLDEAPIPEGFGVALTASNVEQHLEAQRDARDAYAGDHRDEVERIESMVEAARRGLPY
jgi:hypothetical protein